MRLWALIRKETFLLRRDWHALAVLFLMPATFLILMAFAMSGFNQEQLPPLRIHLQVEQSSTDSDFFISALQTQLGDSQLEHSSDNQHPIIHINKNFSAHLLDTPHIGPSLSFPAAADPFLHFLYSWNFILEGYGCLQDIGSIDIDYLLCVL